MSPLVKTKRQGNFKDFYRFGLFKGLVEQKKNVFNSFLCQLGFFGTRGPLKRSFHSRFKLAHSCQKNPNLHKNSSNKLLIVTLLLVSQFWPTSAKKPNLYTNELKTRFFFCSTSPLKAPNRSKSLKLA
jgi:hypothetical protein